MIPPKTWTSPCYMPFPAVPAVLLHGISPDTHHLQTLFEAQHAGEANSVVPGAGHASCGPRLAHVASILWYSTKTRTAMPQASYNKRLTSSLFWYLFLLNSVISIQESIERRSDMQTSGRAEGTHPMRDLQLQSSVLRPPASPSAASPTEYSEWS